MDKAKSVLKICLTLSLITLIVYFFIMSYFRLDEPVFFENYIELYAKSLSLENRYGSANAGSEMYEFSIEYIANVDDNRKVQSIDFLGSLHDAHVLVYHPISSEPWSLSPSFLSNPGQDWPEYGPYSIHTIDIQIHNKEYPAEPIILTDAVIRFTNNDSLQVDLGKIILYPPAEANEHIHISPYTGQTLQSFTCTAMKDIEIEQLGSILYEELNAVVPTEITTMINGRIHQDLTGYSMNKDDILTINVSFNPFETQVYNQYRVLPAIRYRDQSGQVFTQYICHNDYPRSTPTPYSFQGLLNYLRQREVI